MTPLEKIGMERLRILLIEIQENLSDKNENRQEHLRVFSKAKIREAIEVCEAINPRL
jgi:hypothetical protein